MLNLLVFKPDFIGFWFKFLECKSFCHGLVDESSSVEIFLISKEERLEKPCLMNGCVAGEFAFGDGLAKINIRL